MERIVTLSIAAALALSIAPDLALAKNAKHCPPGLAKKTPACVPPGLAKKGVEHDRGDDHGDNWNQDDYHRLREGDIVILDGREYVVVETSGGIVLRRGGDFYRLPVFGDGSEIVRVGDAILRVDRKTKAVIELIELADLLLN